MKKILGLLIILTSFSAAAQNTFSISSESEQVGNSFTLDIDLVNSTEVNAFQFDLSHNENAYQLSSGSALTTRAENHTLTVSTVDDNTIRVLVYSASNEVITAGSGTVLSLTFSSENEPGTYNLSMSDIVLSDQNGESMSVSATSGSVTLLGPKYNLTTTGVNFGEIPIASSPTQSVTITNTGNENLVITSYDTEAPFSISQTLPVTIMPGNDSSFTVEVDTSTKQEVTSELSFSTNDQDPLRAIQSSTIQADIFAVNEIHIGSGTGEINTSVNIPVSINNMESFNGFQLDITLPQDIVYVDNSIDFSGRESDHSILASVIGENTLRILAFSNSNSNFSETSGEVFTFDLLPSVNSGTYPLPISGQVISNIELGNIESESYAGTISINAPNLYLSSSNFNLGRIPITTNTVNDISLTNTGNASLIVDEVIYNSNSLSSSIQTPLTLSINESSNKTITFSPSSLGQFSSSISIRHNGASEQNVIKVTADVFTPNYLYVDEQNVYRDQEHIIKLNISNNDEIRAVQFDINIPDGFTFNPDNTVSLSILNDFTVSISDLGNGNYRFIIYTVSNSIITAGNNALLDLPIFVTNSISLGDYNFDISNIFLSDASNQNISSEALTTGVIHVIENSAPQGVDDTLAVDEDSDLTNKEVITNDTDIDGDVLSVTGISYSGLGTVVINTNATSIDYTPALNFNGSEQITYTVSDGELTATAILTVTVNPVNDAPQGVDDTLAVDEDSDLTNKEVITNDTDIDGDVLSVTGISYSGLGTVVINTNATSIDYTPALNFNGSEQITYTVSDGELTATAILTVTVNPVNDAPVAVDDTFTIQQGNTEIVTLIASDVDGDNLSYSIVEQPSQGSVTIDGDQATYIAAGTSLGSDSFTFTAFDGILNSNEATMSIDVTLDLLNFELDNVRSYPNPFNSFHFIDSPILLKLEIYDINGRILINRSIDVGENKIDFSRFSSGFYIFKYIDKERVMKKIVIKN